eukprot:gene10145-2564_t
MKIKPEVEPEVIEKNTTNENKKIDVSIQNNSILFGEPYSDENVSICFQRTLRIPDDDKTYPLPPSLGQFPIEKVDDYLDKVPEEWKKHGGVFIPMYQREAMWIQFKGKKDSPKAVKIAVGKVNAISGESWNQNIQEGENDYVVIPDQPWLDGINAGDGTIRQFVAMPLGSGYTVEGQVTGKEEFGGIQLCVYDKKPNTFQRIDPIVEPIYLPEPEPISPEFPGDYPGDIPFDYDEPIPDPYDQQVFPAGGYSGEVPESETTSSIMLESIEMKAPMFDPVPTRQSNIVPKPDKKPKHMRKKKKEEKSAFSEAKEMGLASGGKMKQKIYRDKFGSDYWDETNFGRVYVHIVNSAMYSQITGKSPPKTPVKPQTYKDYGYQWYDIWDEDKSSIPKSNTLSNVKSIKQIDQEKKDEIRDGQW